MTFKSAMKIYDLLDSAYADGKAVTELFLQEGAQEAKWERLQGEAGFTDVVRIVLKGKNGRLSGGPAPTLDLSGSLVGIGARPATIGLIGDGDGALVTLASGLKFLDMARKGDGLEGDIVILLNITAHCTNHGNEPIADIFCPVNFWEMKSKFIDQSADAILDVNVTRSSKVINKKGFAITPTVKEGWLLRVSDDALRIMEQVTGEMPGVLPLTMQDLTPTRNGVRHINDIGALPEGTKSPCIGVALTSALAVNECGSGMTNLAELDCAIRFCVEVAKEFGRGKFSFYDPEEFQKLVQLYGPMNHLQTFGKQ